MTVRYAWREFREDFGDPQPLDPMILSHYGPVSVDSVDDEGTAIDGGPHRALPRIQSGEADGWAWLDQWTTEVQEGVGFCRVCDRSTNLPYLCGDCLDNLERLPEELDCTFYIEPAGCIAVLDSDGEPAVCGCGGLLYLCDHADALATPVDMEAL